MTAKLNGKLAYSLSELADVGGPGRTMACELVKSGKLKAHKMGDRTVVLASDLLKYLEKLPVYRASG